MPFLKEREKKWHTLEEENMRAKHHTKLELEGQLSQAQRADLGAARTQTVKSLLNLGGIGTTPTQPSLNIKLT